MKFYTIIPITLLLVSCATTGSYNKVFSHTDPVSGKTTTTYRIELDNSGGSFLTAGSKGGRIDITCSNHQITNVLIDPTKGLANGWLDIRFDNNKHYEIQGTDTYPYHNQSMYPNDAKKFVNDVISHNKAIMKVGTHKGYSVMTAHLESLPKNEIKNQCTSL